MDTPPTPPNATTPPERPALLAIGLLLQALNAALAALLYGLGALMTTGLMGFSLAAVPLFQVWPFSLVVALGAVFFLVALGFHLFVLYTCWRAWGGDRTWLWVLIVVSVLGLVSTGPVSVVIGVVTIVGAWQQLQALDRRR